MGKRTNARNTQSKVDKRGTERLHKQTVRRNGTKTLSLVAIHRDMHEMWM